MTRLNGRGASPGCAIGRAVVAVSDARQVRYRLAASGVDRERQRLKSARARARTELEQIAARVTTTTGEAQAAIFAAQMLMLDDPLLAGRADTLIRDERINADWAIQRAIDELHERFGGENLEWFSARAGDLADVAGRLQRNLRPGRDALVDLVRELEPPVIVVVDDLPPSVAAQLDWSRVRGLVCDGGGPTHHTVILARSLGIPAVVGADVATRAIAPGQPLAIDGDSGDVWLDPSEDVVERLQRRTEAADAAQRALASLRALPGLTADGVRIRLEANLEIADEVGRVKEAGAEGIGLYRSEFLLDSAHPDHSSEEAQVETYRRLLEAMHPLPVTVRTFDAADSWDAKSGDRSRFGLRGIRAALHGDDRFTTQMRALLRSAAHGPLRILLPFVTTVDEVQQVRGVIREIAQGAGLSADVPLGVMIETPAAALAADHLAREADFMSVGTNDLIQYTLAIDRGDERLANRYDPRTPAVVRLLGWIAALTRRSGRPLSVCGEMAADPTFVALLVGLGYRSLSMTPSAIPVVKRALSALDSREAATAARRAMRRTTPAEVSEVLAPLADMLYRAVAG